MVKKDALLVYLQRRLFLLFYRATALQRGKSFPSCAWRMPLLHRNFSLAFALDFLDLTTFLRQILGKIEPSSLFFLIKFCTLFHSFPTVLYTSHIPVQSPFLHCPFRKINCPNRYIYNPIGSLLPDIFLSAPPQYLHLPQSTFRQFLKEYRLLLY